MFKLLYLLDKFQNDLAHVANLIHDQMQLTLVPTNHTGSNALYTIPTNPEAFTHLSIGDPSTTSPKIPLPKPSTINYYNLCLHGRMLLTIKINNQTKQQSNQALDPCVHLVWPTPYPQDIPSNLQSHLSMLSVLRYLAPSLQNSESNYASHHQKI